MSHDKLSSEGGAKKVANPVSEVPPKLEVSETPPDTRAIDDLRRLAQSPEAGSGSSAPFEESQKLDEKIQRARSKKLENDGVEKDQRLKEKTLYKLFRLLWCETVVIFVLTFFQGFKYRGFHLDQWTLRLVVSATLTQITAMLLIAVQHLFPNRDGHSKPKSPR